MAVWFGSAGGVVAQLADTATRSVRGLVISSGGKPVTGAVVQLKDLKTLQVRSFVTQDDGSYHFNGLNPDIEYEVRAEHQGRVSAAKVLSAFAKKKELRVVLKLKK